MNRIDAAKIWEDGVATTLILRSDTPFGGGLASDDLAAIRADDSFVEVDPTTLSAADVARFGQSASFFDRDQRHANVHYFVNKDATRPEIVKFVDITTTGAGVRSALAGADVLLYAGHSLQSRSPQMPLVLPRDLSVSDLPAPSRYRVDVFRSCSSRNYLHNFPTGELAIGLSLDTTFLRPMIAVHHAIVNGRPNGEIAPLLESPGFVVFLDREGQERDAKFRQRRRLEKLGEVGRALISAVEKGGRDDAAVWEYGRLCEKVGAQPFKLAAAQALAEGDVSLDKMREKLLAP